MNALEYYRTNILRRELPEVLPWSLWLLVVLVISPSHFAWAIAGLGGWYASGAAERIAGGPARDGNWEFLLTRSLDRDSWFRSNFWPGLIALAGFALLGVLVVATDLSALVQSWVAEHYPGTGSRPLALGVAIFAAVFPFLVYADSFYFALGRDAAVETASARFGSMVRAGVVAGLVFLVIRFGHVISGSSFVRPRDLREFPEESALGLADGGLMSLVFVLCAFGARNAVHTLEVSGSAGSTRKAARSWSAALAVILVVFLILVVMLVLFWGARSVQPGGK